MTDPLAIFAAVALAHALGVISPGPDLAVVIRQTLAYGRRIGVITALGIGSGILFHSGWGLFGLGWVADQWPWFVGALRYAGATVLLWIGINALSARPGPDMTPQIRPAPSRRSAYLIGLATNLFNAKAFLFFVALSSSVLAAGASVGLRLAMVAWLSMATAAWFSFLAYSVGHATLRQRLHAHAWRIDRALGLMLIALAVAIILG